MQASKSADLNKCLVDVLEEWYENLPTARETALGMN